MPASRWPTARETRTKYDLATTAAAAMAYIVLNQTDSVGVATLAGNVRSFLRPSGQITQLREACRVMTEGPFTGPASLGPILNELAGRTGRRGIAFVFSDLLDDMPQPFSTACSTSVTRSMRS